MDMFTDELDKVENEKDLIEYESEEGKNATLEKRVVIITGTTPHLTAGQEQNDNSMIGAYGNNNNTYDAILDQTNMDDEFDKVKLNEARRKSSILEKYDNL